MTNVKKYTSNDWYYCDDNHLGSTSIKMEQYDL